MQELNDNERRVLEYLNGKRAVSDGELMVQLSISDDLVVDALQILATYQLIRLHEGRTSGMDLYTADITGRGRLYLQGRDYQQSLAQMNATIITASNLNNSPIIQGSQNVVDFQIVSAFAPFYDAIKSQKDLNDYVKDDLNRKVSDLEEAVRRKNKGRYEQIKSLLIIVAPFLLSVFERPDFQDFIRKNLVLG